MYGKNTLCYFILTHKKNSVFKSIYRLKNDKNIRVPPKIAFLNLYNDLKTTKLSNSQKNSVFKSMMIHYIIFIYYLFFYICDERLLSERFFDKKILGVSHDFIKFMLNFLVLKKVIVF